MPSDLAAYTAILIMAAVTLATRFLGAEIMQRVTASKRVESFLDALSPSVIAAIVVTYVAQNGLREAMAVAMAGIVMLAFNSAIWAMIAGMAVAASWAALIG